MTLKRKKKNCIKCGKERVIWGKGMCKSCSVSSSPRRKKPTKKQKKQKTIPQLKKEARYWFQRWIRYRDLGKRCCYGSGIYLEDIRTFDACHYLKFELYPEAGFDENNVHGGSKGENIRDATIEYRKELIRRFGEQFITELETKYKINRETRHKWDREFLQGIIDEYKERVKKIEEECEG